MQYYATIVQQLYSLGARKIGVTTLPPMGCLPASITLFGDGSHQCLPNMNVVALSFNNKLNITSLRLQNKLTVLNLVILDIYQSLYDLVTKPADFVGTCANASQYVFWDGFHPSEAANKILAANLLASGIALIG
ncbi:hypothetical protein POM88_021374 [Heracleum sosnowskyi]|uniref:GDSL esterase/lipase n=1 Tax=Heracleum sosnowskyi TaxID=360622 RepID=A0AAD8IEP5_9APIA|nr:hypothetical protein POM88_021374 [Heracleum sosnowskyi]